MVNSFQSTLPLRGATTTDLARTPQAANFNPHSPCGERPVARHAAIAVAKFQSTLPLRGATTANDIVHCKFLFQSTLPLRGATRHNQSASRPVVISIHTLLAGSDSLALCTIHSNHHISIHTPLAGSDKMFGRRQTTAMISIHTPLAGSDAVERLQAQRLNIFQSTLPLRGATFFMVNPSLGCQFQSTLPLRGATAEMRHF